MLSVTVTPFVFRFCVLCLHGQARRIDSFASQVISILLVIFDNFFKLSKMSHLSHVKTKNFVYVVYELDQKLRIYFMLENCDDNALALQF